MLADMPDDQAARAAFAVASQYARIGQWDLARETFLLMVDRYPAHPLAADAYRWLIRHNSSSEARRRHELGQFLVVPAQRRARTGRSRQSDRCRPIRPAAKPGTTRAKPRRVRRRSRASRSPRRAAASAYLSDQAETRQWYQGSLDLETKLAALRPAVRRRPDDAVLPAAARRNLGDFETPQKWYTEFAARQPDGPWRQRRPGRAVAGQPHRARRPSRSLPAARTDTRPFLDGKLDDACWQDGAAAVAPATTPPATRPPDDYPTEVRLAYDHEFLYLAVRCRHPAGEQEQPAEAATHDADLRGHDRVSLLLDLDRDYATCFHLQVDQRGCVPRTAGATRRGTRAGSWPSTARRAAGRWRRRSR